MPRSLWGTKTLRTTTCRRGHLFTPEHTKLRKRGNGIHRECQICRRIRQRQRWQRRLKGQPIPRGTLAEAIQMPDAWLESRPALERVYEGHTFDVVWDGA